MADNSRRQQQQQQQQYHPSQQQQKQQQHQNHQKNNNNFDQQKHQEASLNYLQQEGILNSNEKVETLYLGEEEIQKFMENYLRENPGTEVETRYISQPPVDVTQNIEVRWLRPETPDLPPIIIKEVDEREPEQPPIRIVQTRSGGGRQAEMQAEPLIFRERPPTIIPEPQVVYVQNVIKRGEKGNSVNKTNLGSNEKEIKIEHVSSGSQNSILKGSCCNPHNHHHHYNNIHRCHQNNNNNNNNNNNSNRFQQPPPILLLDDEYEAQYEAATAALAITEKLDAKQRESEDKLKQTLYEEYLQKQKQQEQRERNNKQQQKQQQQTKTPKRTNNNKTTSKSSSNGISPASLRVCEELRLKEERERPYSDRGGEKQQQNSNKEAPPPLVLPPAASKDTYSNSSSCTSASSDTSSYKTIKFTKVTDADELRRLEAILNNPNAPTIRNKAEGDKIMSSIANDPYLLDTVVNETTTNNNNSEKKLTISNNNAATAIKKQPQMMTTTSSNNAPVYHTIKQNNYSQESSPSRQSQSTNHHHHPHYHQQQQQQQHHRAQQPQQQKVIDKKCFEPSSSRQQKQACVELPRVSTSCSTQSQGNTTCNDISNSSTAAVRRQKITSITSYYSTNYPTTSPVPPLFSPERCSTILKA